MTIQNSGWGGAQFVAALTAMAMVSLSPIVSPAPAQTVVECWEVSSTPPVGGYDGAAAIIDFDSQTICITGTRTDDDMRQIYTRWVPPDTGLCEGPPDGVQEHLWPHPADGESVAARLARTVTGSAYIAWVGGKKTKDLDSQQWSAVILPYRYELQEWLAPDEEQTFIFGESTSGDHEVVAMDGIDQTNWTNGAGLVLAAIRSGPAFNEQSTSTLVVLRATYGNELVVDVLLTRTVDFEVRDVRIEKRLVGNEDYVRFWAVGHKTGLPTAGRVFAFDFGEEETDHAFTVSSMHTVPSRFVLGPALGEGEEPDLFITGYAAPLAISPVPDPNDKTRMLVSRFGNMSGSYGFRWHELYDGDSDVVGHDIGVAQAQLDGNGSTPESDVIYVAGSSKRQIATNPDVFSNDFTVWCIVQTPPLWNVDLRWEAKLREDDGDDRAFRMLIDPGRAEAIVTGVVENTSGHWDWATAKYTRDMPALNEPKDPAWQIYFPLNFSSVGNDAPVGVSTYATSGYTHLYVGGTSVGAQGEKLTMVHYVQQWP